MVTSSPRALVGLLAASAATLTSAAAVPVNAARDSNPGCTAASFHDFSWTIGEFVYNKSITFSTPAHQIASGNVQFNLTNPALTYPAVCTAYSTQLSDFFYGNQVYECKTEGNPGTSTTFTFNAPSSTLNINQTWTCSDEDAQYPDTFIYAGQVNLTMECTTSTYQNPDWEIGQIYSSNFTNCKQSDVTVPPYQEEAEA